MVAREVGLIVAAIVCAKQSSLDPEIFLRASKLLFAMGEYELADEMMVCHRDLIVTQQNAN